ncbi:hypothetical protein PDESU_03997 [Pontiella desulfatans]|uniref:Uncharacterized protein n=1 Tax=Pontiella desulfatans TaxID=2750659 RepID=A0A6C2U7K4_PONDE|nr:hypothetical protein [Pontiella desulfatans]VGO15414.1 hypothetical protein PDESU_03997 [Pontiella desulfatans]
MNKNLIWMATLIGSINAAVFSQHVFEITSFSSNGQLTWTNSYGASEFSIECSTNLLGEWTAISPELVNIPGTSYNHVVEIPLNPDLPEQFYRVVGSIPNVGVDYHSYSSDFKLSSFINMYHQPSVRQIVQAQLQGMADSGATRISTKIWLVTEPGSSTFGDTWRSTFPLSDQEQANIRTYAQDVADVKGIGGNRLRLDLGMLWLGTADYTRGNPADGLGWRALSEDVFTNRVNLTTDKVIAAVSGIDRPDGVPVVETVYLNGEVMIGAKANEEWFMNNLYPRFVSVVSNAGFTPSVYFIVADSQENVLQNDYVDAEHPILNNHRSMYWVYRTLRHMSDNSLPIPARIDFSYYVPSSGATYQSLLSRVLHDADATLPSLGAPQSYGLAETYYFDDDSERHLYGQAIAEEMKSNQRLKLITFWTTPDGGGTGVNMAYPFEFNDYRLTAEK